MHSHVHALQAMAPPSTALSRESGCSSGRKFWPHARRPGGRRVGPTHQGPLRAQLAQAPAQALHCRRRMGTPSQRSVQPPAIHACGSGTGPNPAHPSCGRVRVPVSGPGCVCAMACTWLAVQTPGCSRARRSTLSDQPKDVPVAGRAGLTAGYVLFGISPAFTLHAACNSPSLLPTLCFALPELITPSPPPLVQVPVWRCPQGAPAA